MQKNGKCNGANSLKSFDSLNFPILDSLISPASYMLFRRDRCHHGGGVFILIKSNIPTVRRPDLETHCELVWLQLFTKGGLFFGVFYHPPTTSIVDIEELNSSLSLIPDNSPIIFCIDFNRPNIDWSLVTPTCSSSVNRFMCSLLMILFSLSWCTILPGKITSLT